MKYSLFIFCICTVLQLQAQQPAPERLVDWSTAGLSTDIISPDSVYNILDYGGIPDGTASNHTAFNNVKAAIGNTEAIIYFPPGEYFFSQAMAIKANNIVKGAGSDSTFFKFDLNGNAHCIRMQGSRGLGEVKTSNSICKGQFHIPLVDTAGLNPGDYFLLLHDDASLVNDSWAEGSVGQINRITAIGADRIFIEHAIRRNYPFADSPYIEIINPLQHSGVECLHVERLNNTTNNVGIITMNIAAECWIKSVETEMCSYAHVVMARTTKSTVSGNYFHHAHSYGTAGNAYGVALEFTSGDNLIENNIFEHLRHSILLQAGVNGNVLSYNFSTDPFKTVFGFPTDQTGDLVCHGNYPYANLFEGNIASYGIIDASHGANGLYNTYFRNRMDLYGMQISNSSPDNDGQNIIGNEINSYSITETDHYEFGNNQNGTTIPAGTDTLTQLSYYLSVAPSYFDTLAWPSIGLPSTYQSGTIPAKIRHESGTNLIVSCPHHKACPLTLQIDDIAYIVPNYQAVDSIRSSATIYPFQQIKMKAELETVLEKEFEVRLGGELEISIGNCGN